MKKWPTLAKHEKDWVVASHTTWRNALVNVNPKGWPQDSNSLILTQNPHSLLISRSDSPCNAHANRCISTIHNVRITSKHHQKYLVKVLWVGIRTASEPPWLWLVPSQTPGDSHRLQYYIEWGVPWMCTPSTRRGTWVLTKEYGLIFWSIEKMRALCVGAASSTATLTQETHWH